MSPFVSGGSHHHSGATTIRVPPRGVQNLQLYYIRTANNSKQRTLDHLLIATTGIRSTRSRRPPQQLRKRAGIQPGAPSLTLRSQNQPGGQSDVAPSFYPAAIGAWRQSHSRRMQKPTATAGWLIAPASSVCSTGARHVLSLTAENLLFPATRRCRRDRTPSRNETGRLSASYRSGGRTVQTARDFLQAA